MAKITSRAQLNVGTELTVNEVARTFTLNVAGNLVAKDGVSIQALYSKFVDLWATASYQDSPFPMNAIDTLSGQYQIGVDPQGNFNGWAPANDTTRNMLRDGGWEEYNSGGTLLRVYAGFIGLGTINAGAQPYYHLGASDAPTNFPFTDQFNVGVQVFGNAANGNFDKRTYAKTFVREYGKKFKTSVLSDTGRSGTGSSIVNFLISNEDDLKITVADGALSGAPYSGITVSYYTADQTRSIGGSNYPFRIIVNGNNATLEQIYTKVQYLLRQATDINTSGTAGAKVGKIQSDIMSFVGDTLVTATGVYIDNVQSNDTNRVEFYDQNGVKRSNPYVSAGTMLFNPALVGAGSSYHMYFAANYGTASAVTVKNASGVDITGTISSGSIGFTFDYDNDTLGGTAGTDKSVVLMGIRPGSGKFAVATGTLSRSKGITLSLTAETDRGYV